MPPTVREIFAQQEIIAANIDEWINVEFDGTLAESSDRSFTPGPPVPSMVKRVTTALAEGKQIRLFTAGVWPEGQKPEQLNAQVTMLAASCVEHVGQELPVTCRKDWDMAEMWDDKYPRVGVNTGQFVEPFNWSPAARRLLRHWPWLSLVLWIAAGLWVARTMGVQ